MREMDFLMYKGTTKQLRDSIEEMKKRQLREQKESWENNYKSYILTYFHLKDLNTAFFIRRNEFRKRSNLILAERFLMIAPSNVEYRVPVALRKSNEGIILYDPYGELKVTIEKEPEYELEEDRIYIMKLTKHYPMYQNEIVLGENRNGYELYLKPTPLLLKMQPETESDYDLLREIPEKLEREEAIDIINGLQNRYRLKNYPVVRENEVTILVEGKENFIVSYRQYEKTLCIGILTEEEMAC